MDIENQILNRITKNKQKTLILSVKQEKSDYFFLKPQIKSDYVAHRLLSLRQPFLDALSIKEFKPISFQSQKPFYTYGMISSKNGSKIEDDVYIFNSIDESNIPYKLNLSNLDVYSFFNGQIVAMLVSNAAENTLLVHKIYYLPTIKINTLQKDNISINVVKGVFNPKKLDQIFTSEASSYILMGPFATIDGAFKTFDDFIYYIEEKISTLPSIKVILIPSTEDYLSIKVFPQPPLKIKSNRIYSLPNPGIFYINNHLINVCNFDNYIDLCYEEFSKNSNSPSDKLFSLDRNSRLAHHLVFQQSFVPCLNSLSNVAYGECLDINCVSDIFIINSKLKHFNYQIGPCSFINMGTCSTRIVKIHSNGAKTASYTIEEQEIKP